MKPRHDQSKAVASSQQLQFRGVAIRDLVYHELPIPNMTIADLHTSGALQEQSLQLQSQIGFAPPNLVEVTILTKMMPVGDLKVFELSVKLSGLFQKAEGISNRDAAGALSDIAGRMLFPFIREALMTMTAKTMVGMLPVQPLVLGPLFTDAQIAEILD